MMLKRGAIIGIIAGTVGAVIGGCIMSGIGKSGAEGSIIYIFPVPVLGKSVFIIIPKALSH